MIDEAANMSGIYNGLQVHIKKIQPLAIHVHCTAHNLNVVINDSIKNTKEVQNFYEKLENLLRTLQIVLKGGYI